jgi:hypothetical protein
MKEAKIGPSGVASGAFTICFPVCSGWVSSPLLGSCHAGSSFLGADDEIPSFCDPQRSRRADLPLLYKTGTQSQLELYS